MFLSATRALDERLERRALAPLVVAFSGGGDSLALLLIAKVWAEGAGRRLIAMTVDHQLQAAGAEWARWCARRAAQLGVEHCVLSWEGAKPTTGLPAAARQARHSLLAQAARAEGGSVILMGHTADDCLEAGAMRADGSSTPTPRTWSPSPVWPEGRGVFVLRPMIGLRRAEIRRWLAERGESWIDDPANEDLCFARARARRDVSSGNGEPRAAGGQCPIGAQEVREDFAALRVPRAAVGDQSRAFLAALLLCASGTIRPPRGERLRRLHEALKGFDPLVATLAGARVEADGEWLRVMREPGDMRRVGLASQPLEADSPMVWDGRFELASRRAGLTVRPLAGLASRLPKDQAAALRAAPPAARRGLPALVDARGTVTCPILADVPGISVRSLVMGRLLATLGATWNEAAIWRVANGGWTP